MRLWLNIFFVCSIMLAAHPASAQGVEPDHVIRFTQDFSKVSRGVTLYMHRPARANGWSIRLVDARNKTLAVTSVPEWAGASYYDIVAVADKIENTWIVVFEAKPKPASKAPPAAETYQAAFAFGKSTRGKSKIWKAIATTSFSDLEGGQRLRFRQAPNGKDELMRTSSDDSTFCGGEAGYQVFEPAKLAFRTELNEELLAEGAGEAKVSLPEQRFALPIITGYYLWYSATSDRRNPDNSLTVIRPLELGDNNVETVWIEGDAGDGKGQFVTARINPGLKLRGFRIFPGHGLDDEHESFRSPKRLLVSLGDGTRYIAELPDVPLRTLKDRGGLIVRFPEGVRTKCVSVVLLQSRAGSQKKLGDDAWKASSTAIGEITPLSELYGLSKSDAAIVVVEMLLKQENPADARRLALLASPLGEDLVLVLSRVVQAGSAEDRARIAPLLRYMPAKQSVPVLEKLFRRVKSSDPSYLAIKRSLITHREEAAPVLVSMLYDSPPTDERKHLDLIRMVGRLGDPKSIIPMTEQLGQGNTQTRHERIRSVARGGTLVLPPLFAIIHDEPNTPKAIDALGAVSAIGRQVFYHTQGKVDGAEVLVQTAKSAKLKREILLSIEALAYFETEGAVDLLSEFAKTGHDPLVRRVSIDSLSRYAGEDARRTLENSLKDPSPDVRIRAAKGIADRPDKEESMPALAEYIQNERWPAGLSAGYAVLAGARDPSIAAIVEKHILSEPYGPGAELAAGAVERAERTISAAGLSTLIRDPKTSFMMKRHAVDMLGVETSEEGELLLLDIIGTPGGFQEFDDKRNETLRGRAILALGRRRTTNSKDALLYLLRDEKEASTQKLVLRALAFYPDESIIPELTVLRESAPSGLAESYDDTISMIERRGQVKAVGDTVDRVEDRFKEKPQAEPSE